MHTEQDVRKNCLGVGKGSEAENRRVGANAPFLHSEALDLRSSARIELSESLGPPTGWRVGRPRGRDWELEDFFEELLGAVALALPSPLSPGMNGRHLVKRTSRPFRADTCTQELGGPDSWCPSCA